MSDQRPIRDTALRSRARSRRSLDRDPDLLFASENSLDNFEHRLMLLGVYETVAASLCPLASLKSAVTPKEIRTL